MIARRLLLDRLARWVVTLGGAAIIVSILAILFVIVAEVYPLFRKPTAALLGVLTTRLDSAPLAVGVDEYREIVYVVTASGVHFTSVKDGTSLASNQLHGLHGATVVGTSSMGRGPFALGLSDGRAIPAEVRFSVTFPEGRRRIEVELEAGDQIAVDPERHPLVRLAYASTPNGPMIAAAVGPKAIVLVTVKETKALIGPSTKEESHQRLTLPVEGEIAQLILDGRGENLFAGTSSGQIIRVDLRNPSDPKVAGITAATIRPGIGVSAMGFLIGDRTLVVGDTMGGVSSWQFVQANGEGQRLTKVHDFLPHTGPAIAFAPSRRDKGFVTADASGIIHIHYGTTGKTLLTLKAGQEGLRAAAFAPKADGVITVDAKGGLSHWIVENPHPEISWGSLFGKLWYEGYPAPAYVWQSTGGTDDFEAKFSLTPLIFGTIKGTFYALLFAIPLALLGALYTSQFMHPTLRGIVKPTVEIMAALPSVVLGFLAGLWLAPLVEKIVPGLFLMPIVITLLILIAVFCWRFVPIGVRSRVKAGTEVALLIPIVILGSWISFQLGGAVERLLLSGDYRGWLLSVLGLTYDQRNSLVVGIAMGFAVIPIIFTIAEDSLSNVPQHLAAGSLALGATRWQTALRVVLPTASPGIFSAIMIGFGRAVGETMIVLMATGNTPVMDWSIFNGFRALSANIAVELPEAPEGGTLFRILFLAALLLFVMTFIVNTLAELVRLKLRKRYRSL
ncbi:MAG: ABC transporter permease subunit [candidate division NC10 bacterium]|nr:ABC transporter permease subunit [candidate division NC10 bacterium]MDE2322721.1 ABC transporter permease subunit [candidate division NC10 bacterium]